MTDPTYAGLVTRLHWVLESPATDRRFTAYASQYIRAAADALEAQGREIAELRVAVFNARKAALQNKDLVESNRAEGERLRGLLREWLIWAEIDADGDFDVSDTPVVDMVGRTRDALGTASQPK